MVFPRRSATAEAGIVRVTVVAYRVGVDEDFIVANPSRWAATIWHIGCSGINGSRV